MKIVQLNITDINIIHKQIAETLITIFFTQKYCILTISFSIITAFGHLQYIPYNKLIRSVEVKFFRYNCETVLIRDAESTSVRKHALGEIFGALSRKDVFCCFPRWGSFRKNFPTCANLIMLPANSASLVLMI